MRVSEQTKASTRQALLEAAAVAFAEHGYYQTKIDSISQQAGVAKGTIYNYFSSKEDVLHALIREACDRAGVAASDTPESAATEERLRMFVSANLRWAQEREALALLFARELLAGDARVKALIAEAAAPCVEKVAAIIQTGIDRGELGPAAPAAELATTFIALTNMLLLQGREGPLRWPAAEQLPAAATALFLRGIGARGE